MSQLGQEMEGKRGGEEYKQQEHLGALTDGRACFAVPRVEINTVGQAGHPAD